MQADLSITNLGAGGAMALARFEANINRAFASLKYSVADIDVRDISCGPAEDVLRV